MMTPMPDHCGCLFRNTAVGMGLSRIALRSIRATTPRQAPAVARTERSELREATHDDADAGPLRMPIPKCCRRHGVAPDCAPLHPGYDASAGTGRSPDGAKRTPGSHA